MKRSYLPKSTFLSRFSVLSTLIILAVFTLAGCSPDAAITAPDDPEGDDAPSLEVLESKLHDMILAFETDLAAGRFRAAPPSASKQSPADTRVLQSSAINYLFTTAIDNDINAQGYGVNCPGPNSQIDTARIIDVLALDSTKIDNMNTALATVGGSVTLEHTMEESFSTVGNGTGAYTGTLIAVIQHAAGGQTLLDQTPASGASLPDTATTARTLYTVSLTPADVALMADGDNFVVAALGAGGAAANGCANSDQSIVFWQRPSGGDPILKILP